MKIYNDINSPYSIRRKLKTTRGNTVKNLLKKIERQEEDVVARMKNAIKIHGNKYTTELNLDELEKTLNTKQKDMILIENAYKKYSKRCSKEFNMNISEYITNLLIRFKFINKITVAKSGNEFLICNKPHTDIYIKPYVIEGNDNIYIEEHLVVSPELAEDIQNHCKSLFGNK